VNAAFRAGHSKNLRISMFGWPVVSHIETVLNKHKKLILEISITLLARSALSLSFSYEAFLLTYV
jgi:hypothetical protein